MGEIYARYGRDIREIYARYGRDIVVMAPSAQQQPHLAGAGGRVRGIARVRGGVRGIARVRGRIRGIARVRVGRSSQQSSYAEPQP